MDDRELMGIRADTCYTYDLRGRMVQTNEPRKQERRPAPRVFFGRTGAGSILRFGSALPDNLTWRLEQAANGLPLSSDLYIPATLLAEVRKTLGQHAPVTKEGGGPTYRFPEPIEHPTKAVRLTTTNRVLLRDTFPWLYDQLPDWQPCFGVIRNDAVVSICFSARIGIRAAEAGVYTLQGFRGHGYAAEVCAAWATAAHEVGFLPLYSTAWDNVASQRVSRRLGLIMFGADATWE